MNATVPLVSILIPAYHARFFAEAFESARAQTYPSIEIVVCDDSRDDAIERIVLDRPDPRVRYVHNPERLGFARNFSRCFELARGEYVKFLNDDDRLRPHCVEKLAGILRVNGGVTLATSRRRVIDAQGDVQPDVIPTMPISHVSAIMLGGDLGNFALANGLNFIGEPSTVLFRRAQVTLEDELLFRWGGHDYHCLADMSLWLRLLMQGLAYYDAESLSDYRRHDGQEQEREGMRFECTLERMWIARQARSVGFLATPRLWNTAIGRIVERVEPFRTSPLVDATVHRRADALMEEARAELAPESIQE